MKSKTKVPVSERAIIQRINRKLKPKDAKLKKLRSKKAWSNLGDYYIVHKKQNFVLDTFIRLESYARELEVLADWEELAE